MGKEKKDKKSKGNKEKKGGGVSVYQALMGYKIANKEKDLEEIKKQLEETIEKNKTLKERNLRLGEAKKANFDKALYDYRYYIENYRNNQEKCDKDEVISEMKQIWALKQTHEGELTLIRKEIRKVEKEISNAKKELKKWTDFKQSGSSRLDTEIKLLKQEIIHMTENYEIVAGKLKRRKKLLKV